MFAYNKFSDLLTGELVIPIRKEGELIYCLDANNNEVVYTFDDFDFEKQEDERNIEDFIEIDDEEKEEEPKEEVQILPKSYFETDPVRIYNILKKAGLNPTFALRNVNILTDII